MSGFPGKHLKQMVWSYEGNVTPCAPCIVHLDWSVTSDGFNVKGIRLTKYSQFKKLFLVLLEAEIFRKWYTDLS